MSAITIRLTVNGTAHEVRAEPRLLLGDLLRDELGLVGTHFGCEHGVCGACTVLLDGHSVRSCLVLAVQADGCDVQTVEGLADGDELHPLQASFQKNHGLQCGFCTPGMLMSCVDIVAKYPDAAEAEQREHLSGNICRCTGYQNIVRALREAETKMRES